MTKKWSFELFEKCINKINRKIMKSINGGGRCSARGYPLPARALQIGLSLFSLMTPHFTQRTLNKLPVGGEPWNRIEVIPQLFQNLP